MKRNFVKCFGIIILIFFCALTLNGIYTFLTGPLMIILMVLDIFVFGFFIFKTFSFTDKLFFKYDNSIIKETAEADKLKEDILYPHNYKEDMYKLEKYAKEKIHIQEIFDNGGSVSFRDESKSRQELVCESLDNDSLSLYYILLYLEYSKNCYLINKYKDDAIEVVKNNENYLPDLLNLAHKIRECKFLLAEYESFPPFKKVIDKYLNDDIK